MSFFRKTLFFFLFSCFLYQNIVANDAITRLNCLFDENFKKSDCDWVISDLLETTKEGLRINVKHLRENPKSSKRNNILVSKVLTARQLQYVNNWNLKLKFYNNISIENIRLSWKLVAEDDSLIKNFNKLIPNNFIDWTDLTQLNLDIDIPFKFILELSAKGINEIPNLEHELKIFNINFYNSEIDFTSYKDCYFNCSDKCIDERKVCNLKNDCINGTDEVNCGPITNFYWVNSDSNQWYIDNATSTVDFHNPDRGSSSIESLVFRPISSNHRNKDSYDYDKCKLRFNYCTQSIYSKVSIVLVELKIITDKNEEIDHLVYDPEYIKKITLRQYKIYEKVGSNSLGCENFEEIVKIPQSMRGNFLIQIHASHKDHTDSEIVTSSIKFTNMFFTKQCFDNDYRESHLDYFKYSAKLHLPRLRKEETLIHSCNSNAYQVPNKSQCNKYYENHKSVNVLDNGVKVYTAPKSAYYTVFISGGKGGSSGTKTTGGTSSLVRGVIYLKEGQKLNFIIGQKGEDSCSIETNKNKDFFCHQHRGAAGGGGTFVYLEENNEKILLLASGGGSGADIDEFYPYESGNSLFFDSFTHYFKKDMKKLGLGKSWYSPELGNLFNKTKEDFFVSLIDSSKDVFNDCPKNENQVRGGYGGGSNSCGKYSGAGSGYKGGFSSIEKGSTGGVSYFNKDRVLYPMFGLNTISNRNISTLIRYFSPGNDKIDLENNGFALIYQRDDNCVVLSDQTIICDHGHPFFFWSFIILLLIGIAAALYYVDKKYGLRRSLRRIPYFGGVVHYDRQNEQNIRLPLRRVSVNSAEIREQENVQPENVLIAQEVVQENPEPSCSRNISEPSSSSAPSNQSNQTTLLNLEKHKVDEKLVDVDEKLGSGNFGIVYLAKLKITENSSEKKLVALKKLIESDEKRKTEFINEAFSLSNIMHNNIVKFIGYTNLKIDFHLIMEYLEGGDLKNFLISQKNKNDQELNIGDLLVYCLDIAKACLYLTHNSFLHLDIAARNCLLTRKTKNSNTDKVFKIKRNFNSTDFRNGFNKSGIIAKLADFGVAINLENNDYSRIVDKSLAFKWMAPEVLQNKPVTLKSDVWSFGILMIEIFGLGVDPYHELTITSSLDEKIYKVEPQKPSHDLPIEIWNLILKCLKQNPLKRISFENVIINLCKLLEDKNLLLSDMKYLKKIEPSSIIEKELIRKSVSYQNIP